MASAISWMLAPSGRRISSSTMAFLLPSRAGAAALSGLADFLGLAAFGAASAAWGVTVGFRAWTALQIRATAVLRSVNFLTGFRRRRVPRPRSRSRPPRTG